LKTNLLKSAPVYSSLGKWVCSALDLIPKTLLHCAANGRIMSVGQYP